MCCVCCVCCVILHANYRCSSPSVSLLLPHRYCHHELKRNVARLHRAHKAILTAEAILSDLLASPPTNNDDAGSKSVSASGSKSGSGSGADESTDWTADKCSEVSDGVQLY